MVKVIFLLLVTCSHIYGNCETQNFDASDIPALDTDSMLTLQMLKRISQKNPQCSPCEAGANKLLFRDCWDVHKAGFRRSGVYPVYPIENKVLVYCDLVTAGGGWTVFQRRMDGSIPFNRTWVEYSNGFGDLRGEFWLGNLILSTLTRPEPYTLRVDMELFNGTTVYAEYTRFSVGPDTLKFALSVGNYSGTAGDSLKYHNGKKFTTLDQDNYEEDMHNSTSSELTEVYPSGCGSSGGGHGGRGGGGNWHTGCNNAYLNGIYNKQPKKTEEDDKGIFWMGGIHNKHLKATSMKFRPTALSDKITVSFQ